MMKKVILVGLALSLLAFVGVSNARADEWNKQTVLTFSQPVEIPGRVLAAGTYMFKLVEVLSDRHVVQIFTADGSQLIATVATIPDYRLRATEETVIRFREMPAGTPEAIRAWFYPGNNIGQEFVYPKRRAIELAKVSNAPVPATAVEVVTLSDLKVTPLIAVTPDQKEAPLPTVIQTTPPPAAAEPKELPKTASALPLAVLSGTGHLPLPASRPSASLSA